MGSSGVILVVWTCPDGCAQAAGIHVMGVGEAAHHERAHLAARRSPYGCAQAAGIQIMGAGEAASHEDSPVWAWQGPGGLGERRLKLQRAG